MYDEHDAALRPILRRIIMSKVDDSGTQQRIDGDALKGDSPRNMVRLQHFGATSVPPEGSEGLALALGGRSDRLWVLGLEHGQYRPTGLPGGAKAIYDQAGNIIKLIGQQVVFTFDGADWSASSKSVKVQAKSGNVEIWTSQNVYLGDPANGSTARVMTEAGVSKNVYAKV